MLFNIVRNTAIRLVTTYTDYCRTMRELGTDCQEDVHDTNDKIQSARSQRALLIELAGEDVVRKLDEEHGFTKLVKAIIADTK